MGLTYQVISRRLPTENEPNPKIYCMCIFVPNEVIVKSQFWVFLVVCRICHFPGLCVMSHAALMRQADENADHDTLPSQPCVCVWWFIYFSFRFTRSSLWRWRTLEYVFAMTRVLAHTTCIRNSVSSHVWILWSLYQDMAARHRACFWSIHVHPFLLHVLGSACLGSDHTCCRFFALWRLKRWRISISHTLNSSSSQGFASHFPFHLLSSILFLHQEIHKFLFMACTSLYKPQKSVK